jgi:hypothetical protein
MAIKYLSRLLFLVLAVLSLAACGAQQPSAEFTAELPLDNATESSAVLISVQVFPGDTEDRRIISEEKIPLPNCNGNVPMSSTIGRSHAVFRVAEIGTSAQLNVSGSLGVPGVGSVAVGSAIAEHYNVSYGEEETVSRSINVAAKEGSHVEHVVQQFETWETGELVIFVGGVEAVREPYSFRKDFGVEVVDTLNIDDCITETSDEPPTVGPITVTDIAATSEAGTATAIAEFTPSPTYTPIPCEVIESFPGSTELNWWSPDPDTFDFLLTSEQSYRESHSYKIDYRKNDTFQHVAAEVLAAHPDFSGYRRLELWVYGNETILFKIEDQAGDQADVGELTATNANGWNHLIFDYTGVSNDVDLSRVKNIFFFLAPGNSSASGTVYFDSVSLCK